mmetsp:Transcript_6964/g.17500  ORF Transcript_6964/g.17500 Transcript_6964/m.17500 type:complete len:330 (-) Transcript_6964:452-1441(-)
MPTPMPAQGAQDAWSLQRFRRNLKYKCLRTTHNMLLLERLLAALGTVLCGCVVLPLSGGALRLRLRLRLVPHLLIHLPNQAARRSLPRLREPCMLGGKFFQHASQCPRGLCLVELGRGLCRDAALLGMELADEVAAVLDDAVPVEAYNLAVAMPIPERPLHVILDLAVPRIPPLLMQDSETEEGAEDQSQFFQVVLVNACCPRPLPDRGAEAVQPIVVLARAHGPDVGALVLHLKARAPDESRELWATFRLRPQPGLLPASPTDHQQLPRGQGQAHLRSELLDHQIGRGLAPDGIQRLLEPSTIWILAAAGKIPLQELGQLGEAVDVQA